jgi:CRISPR-associated endoribonuclease Cas6
MSEADPYPLPAIPYLRLAVTLRAEEPALLPAFHGSMLRGAFGHALRRLVCTMGPEQPCASCLLRRACAYPRIFEPFVEGEPPPFLRGIAQAVRPYVFESQGGAGLLPPGGDLKLDLLLFGQAIDLQAYALLALERMARAGLGSRRIPFRLTRVEAPVPGSAPGGSARTLFAEGSSFSPDPAPPVWAEPAPLPGSRITLRFVTPLRLKVRDRFDDRPSFRTLAFNMLRRVLELAHAHVPGAAVDWSFRPFLEQAAGVQVVDSQLVWQEHERWSNRQQTAMKLGGVVGTMVLEGDLAPFGPLLRTAEIVHVGKGATFGLGQVEIMAAHEP